MFLFKKVFLICCLTLISAQSLSTSLYEESKFKALHEDKKAFDVGDGITILIYENAQAATSSGEGNSADVSFSGGAFVDERDWSGGLKIGSSEGGDAATNRKGYVKAQMTAIVIGSGQDGNLIIDGVQKVRINEEEQIIRVRGRVRIEDISSQNTIASFRIQNAVISIDGEGEVTQGKEGNVFVRMLKWLGF
jgi:flagellar L-ring protein precursor FlgH